MNELLHSPTRFAEWLATLPADVIVGFRNRAHACPLTNFVRTHGYPRARITRDTARLPWRRPIALPMWASVFIRELDMAHSSALTADQTRTILAHALAMVETDAVQLAYSAPVQDTVSQSPALPLLQDMRLRHI